MAPGDLMEEEAAVYDRQLRVWGVEVQRKLTAAKVLIVGFGQLAAEVAKNITLAGVGNLTLLDDSPASSHLGANFLITPPLDAGLTSAQAAARALQALNPLVNVSAAPGSAADVCGGGGGDSGAPSALGELVQHQDLVIAVGLPLLQAQRLGAACRAGGVKFMAASACGPGGWLFLDLQEHTFTPKDAKLPQTLHYAPLEAALAPAAAAQAGPSTHPMYFVLVALWAAEQQLQRPLGPADEAAVRERLSAAVAGRPQAEAAGQLLAWMLLHGEAAPVCAVLGGVIANNVVAAVSGSSAPLNNLLMYSLADGRAVVERQPPAAAAAAAVGKAGGVQRAQGVDAAVEVVALD